MKEDIFLREIKSDRPIPGLLVTPIGEKQIQDFEQLWKPWMDDVLREMQKKSVHQTWIEHVLWDWRTKITEVKGLLAYNFFAVECKKVTQGLMRVRMDPSRDFSYHIQQEKKPLLYIDYLSTAPWNIPEIIVDPQFSRVGMVLFMRAIVESYDQGFNGKIGLHALPQAVSWYNELGMINMGVDILPYEGLPYFELTSDQANLIINRMNGDAS